MRFFLPFIAFLTVVIYVYGFNGAFAYDDYQQIFNRPEIKNIFKIHDVIFNGLRQHRLWQNLIFGLSWTMSDGQTWSFKLFSLALHLLNSAILFRILKRMFSEQPYLPVITTSLFLIHPLQTQSVTYIMGITTLIQSFFYLYALDWYSRFRLSRLPGLCLILFLSLFAKETAMLIPLVLLAYDFLFFRKDGERFEWRKWAVVFAVPLLFFPIYHILKDPVSMFAGTTGFNLFSFFPYIGAQFYYQVFYVYLLFNPTLQSIIHEIPVYGPYGIACGVAGCLMWLSGFWLILTKSKRFPRIVFFLILYFISYLPTNSVLQMINPFAEYRLYLSNVTMFLGIAWVLIRAFDWLKGKGLFHNPHLTLSSMVMVYFSIFSFLTVMVWKSEVKIFVQTLKRYPQSVIANHALAVAYLHSFDYMNSYIYFTESRFFSGWLNKGLAHGYYTIAGLFFAQGKIPEAWMVLDSMEKDKGRDPLPKEYYEFRDKVKEAMLAAGYSLETNFEQSVKMHEEIRRVQTERNQRPKEFQPLIGESPEH